IIIGMIAGALCHFMTTVVKRRFAYDDSLDVFGVHGAAGTAGALLTGVFATGAINPVFKDAFGSALPVGLVDGNPRQLINHSVAVLVSWALGAGGTFAILKVVDLVIGLRVTEEEEVVGLDATQHGEEAYVLEPAPAILAAFRTQEAIGAEPPAMIQREPAFGEAGD